MDNIDFGGQLRKLREQAGLTQRQLADKVGINYSYLSRIESGAFQPPSRELILKLAQVLKADSDELLTLAGKVPTDLAKILKSRSVLHYLRDGSDEKKLDAATDNNGKDNSSKSRVNAFGKRLKGLREKNGLSQADLASKVDINFSYLSKIESGSKPAPSEKVITKLASVLNCDKDELMSLAGKVPADIAHMLKDRRVRQSIRESQKKNLFDMVEGARLMRQFMNGSLARIALAIVLVAVTAGALWFSSPSSVQALDFEFTDPAGLPLQAATIGETYHFKVKVNLEDIDRVPIDGIGITIAHSTDGSAVANLHNLPVVNGSRIDFAPGDTGGGTANVSITANYTGYENTYGYVRWKGYGYSFPKGYTYGGSSGRAVIVYDILWTPPINFPTGIYNVVATIVSGPRNFTQNGQFVMGPGVPPELVAETAISQGSSNVTLGVMVIKVNIDRVKNPADNVTGTLSGGLGSYSATISGSPAGTFYFQKANGAPPYTVPNFDNVTGVFFVNSLTPAQQASNSTLAEIAPILTGNVTTAVTLTVSFSNIAAANNPTVNVPQEASKSLTFRRGDTSNDGTVSIGDALFIAQYIVGQRQLSGISALNAASVAHDTGGNGDKITIGDALFIAQKIVGQKNAYFQ